MLDLRRAKLIINEKVATHSGNSGNFQIEKSHRETQGNLRNFDLFFNLRETQGSFELL